MIIIPMAGLSSRFFNAGYTVPKYMLELDNKTIFEHSVESFKHYFESELFVFICRDVFQTSKFIENKCKKLGIKRFRIEVLSEETRGQAETVMLGLRSEDQEQPLTIFNIDTFRPNFTFPNFLEQDIDGYLEVFCGEGDNWSYAERLSEGSIFVKRTAEKQQISDLCSTGLYYFKRAGDFCEAFNHEAKKSIESLSNGEFYVAPLYNFLIEKGKKIAFNKIEVEEVVFCGTPQEYNICEDAINLKK